MAAALLVLAALSTPGAQAQDGVLESSLSAGNDSSVQFVEAEPAAQAVARATSEVTIAAAGDVLEGQPAVFTLSRTGDTNEALTVNVTVADNATNPVLATATTATTVSFTAGATSAPLSLPTMNIAAAGTPGVTATVTTGTGYTVGTPASAVVAVSAGICGRTAQVRDDILGDLSGVSDCVSVADDDARLAGIRSPMLIHNAGITALLPGDFAGLSRLRNLSLRHNSIASLPEGTFDGLNELFILDLGGNTHISSLPAGIFDDLTKLETLYLDDNNIAEVPDGLFAKLTRLRHLNMSGNPGASFAPTAEAGAAMSFTASTATTVTFAGSVPLSGNPWGDNVTYRWTQTDGPTRGVAITDGDTATPSITIPPLISGTVLTFKLSVAGRGGPNPGVANADDTVTATAVSSGTPATGAPTITGVPRVGETLTAGLGTIADDDGLPDTFPDDYTLQWVRVNGASQVDISGATGGSYTLTSADSVTTIRVRVRFTDAADNPEGPLISDETGPISETDVCDRTAQVRDAIVGAISGVSDCARVRTAHLSAIRSLNLYLKGLSALETGDLAGLGGLQGLDLSWNNLTALPSGIFDELTALTALRMQGNDLTALPSGIFDEQTKLLELRLDENDLTALPSGIFDEQTNLLELFLDENDLASLPSGVFDNLPLLRRLYLPKNALTADGLPSGIFDELTKLDTLWLEENDLTSLPSGIFDKLDALEILRLNGNALSALPARIFDRLRKLEGLNLEGNDLASLPDGVFANLTMLTNLRLSGNSGAPFAPTAEAGAAESVRAGVASEVMLMGSAPQPGNPWGDHVSYRWTQTAGPTSGVEIGNADSATPTVSVPALADATELTFTLTVTGKSGQGNGGTAARDTVIVEAVATGSLATGQPSITGTAQVGETLTAGLGTIADADGLPGSFPNDYDIQWQRVDSDGASNARDISNATGGSYTLNDDDLGSRIRVRVNFTDLGGTAEVPLTSATTAVVISDTDVCERTAQVRDAIVDAITGAGDCADVTSSKLATITELDLNNQFISALRAGDFAGLPALATLYLDGNQLTGLPAEIFDGLTALTQLWVYSNDLTSLPAGVFDGLTALTELDIGVNDLTSLPDGVFADLGNLRELGLSENPGPDNDPATNDFAPRAEAGAAVSVEAETATAATLAGSAPLSGNPWGDNVTYGWAQSGGPTSGISIANGNSATPRITVPALAAGTRLTFTLTVTGRGEEGYSFPNAFRYTATDTVTVQAAGALELNLDTIAGDGTVNIAEKAAGFTVTGSTGSESGAAVTVTVGTGTLTATSADDAGTATWSVTVPGGATYIAGTSVDVSVSATKSGFTSPADVERTLTVDLTAPTAPTYTVPASLQVGVAIAAMTPSGGADIDGYGVTGLPSGLAIDTGNGVIGGTPDTADASTASATVTVNDAAGNTAQVSITFPLVAKADQTLSGFRYSASSVGLGSAAPTVTAPSGVSTTLSYSATPATVCTVDSSTGALTLVGAGACVVTATAAATPNYNEAAATFTVTVQAIGTLVLNLNAIAGDDTVNIAEKASGFSIGGDTGTESGVSVTVVIGTETLTATSANDSGTGTWSVSVPAGAAYIAGTGVDVTVSASKSGLTSPSNVTRSLTVDLTAPTAPSYTAPASLKVGVAIAEMTPSGGADIDRYRVTGLPSGLVIDTASGVIDGTPNAANASTASATVTVSDAAGNTATVPIAFPSVARGDQTLSGFGYSASSVILGSTAPTVTAPAGAQTTLGYSATPSSVCSVNLSSGALTLVGAGACVVTATAAATANYNEATATFTVTVQPASTLVLSLNAIAGDDTVNIAEKAAGFSIGGNTGTESGVRVTVVIGTETLIATSTDNAGTATWSVSVPAGAAYIAGTSVGVSVSASKSGFTSPGAVERLLTVDLSAPTAPTYTAPGSLKVGVAIAEMTPSGGADIDRYRVTGLPSGLVIDTASGVIDGTPNAANASTASATVTVSDAAGNTDTVSIAFPAVARAAVARDDQTLSGFQYSASSVTIGSAAPTVTAPTGARTTVSYTAAPSTVCTVDSSTGALTLVGAGECVVTATAASTANYNEASVTYTVTVQAAGTGGGRTESTAVTLTVDPATVNEGAGASTLTVTGTLDEAPRTAETTVTLSVGASGDSAVAGTDYAAVGELKLTIDAGQTSGTATFTLTPTDDGLIEGDETLSVTGTTGLADLTVTGTSITIGDDDERGVAISPTALTVPEGDSATYTVVLGSRPSGTVRVRISGTTGTDLRRSRSFLSFRTTNWNEPQTVTVTARQDEDAEDDTVTLVHAVTGADYEANGVTADAVTVTIDDDDAVSTGVELSVSPTSIEEDAGFTGVVVTGTLNGVTRDEPTTVTVSVGASDDAAVADTDYVAVEDLSLTIPAGQASGTAIFVFTPLEDRIDERVEAVSITGTTEVEGFEVSGTTLSIEDNDERGVTVSATGLSLSEGGSATYTVVLDTEPTETVTVTPTVNGNPDVTFTPSSLTYTSSDWDQAQTVTVSAAQDADAANDTATIGHAVSGADYGANGATADDVSVTVEDDETAVTLTVSPTSVDEGGGGTTVTVTGTFDGATRDEPTTFTVSVGAPDDAATEGTDYVAVNDLSLTIPSGQASATATFTFTPLEDRVDEPDEAVSIAGTTEVEGFEVIGTTLTIDDNDERGVTVSPSDLTLPEGDSATYTVVLDTEPTDTVTVTPTVNGSPDVTVTPSSLMFTPSDWDTAQTVTGSAAQDADAANDTATIAHAVAGADYGANSVTAHDMPVTVEDDETAVTLTVSPAAVDEDANGALVTVTGTLDGVTRDESTTLTVRVGAPDDAATEGTDYATVNDLSLTIPAGQASGTATFALTPMDDRIDEPAEAVTIAATGQVAGFEVIGTTLTITDNDERGVSVSPSDLTLTEGASATYTVVLDTEPTQTVTVTPTVSGSPDLAFTPPSLTFTPSDWDTAQTMTVSATEDNDAYNDSSIVSHAAAGAEYASLVDGAVSVTIADNDVASQDMLPAQVTDLSATATETHVDLTWSAVQDTVLGYRVEASYDGGANWAEVEANTENTENTEGTDSTEIIETAYRHDVGLNFAETRRYRVSAVGENGAGLPSVTLQASATATVASLTATALSPDDLLETAPEDAMESMSQDTTDSMLEATADPVPAIDLCWVPEGVDASELGDVAMAWTPVHSSGSVDLSVLPWQSVGSGSSEVDCEDGIGVRLTSISDNQRYAFRMRASHDGVWLVSNDAQAVLVDSSKPLRTVVTAGTSGLSGDTPVPDLICRDYDDPATTGDEAGSFLLSIGFTTASPEYLRYEPVNDFDPASDLTLVNATAELLDRPYDAQLGYRVRITPSVWGEPVAVSVASDVVTHGETSVGNRASGEFRRETSDAVDCDTATAEPARRSQVVAVGIEADGDRNGEWTAGEPIRVTLQFDERIGVDTTDGVPSVTLALGEAETETMEQSSNGEEATEQSSDGEGAMEATEQSTDGEAAVEVTVPFSHVAHEDTLVFEHPVTANESPIRHIALLADSLSLNGGAIDSFSGPAVDLAHPEAAVVGGQIEQPDLTAGWSMIPGAHEGSETSFEIHLQFSETVDLIEVIGERNLLEHAFTVTDGAIEAIRPARDRRGEYLANEWAIRVVPDSEEPVTISPVVALACDEPGAICTIDDRPLTEAPSVTVHRIEQALSVADTEVGEGPGAALVFEVTLARAADRTVTVDYATADGTATAGEDYEAVSGTLVIEPGQTGAGVEVRVIDDSHDEGEETLTLTLTNATGARIQDGEATGIIVNSDPMPSAWLARFGRAASDQVAQAVARRLDRGTDEAHLRVAGLRLDHLFGSSETPRGGLMNLGSGAAGTLSAPRPAGPDRFAPGATRGLGTGIPSSGPAGGFDVQRLSGDMAAPGRRGPGASDTLPSLRDALLGSSFFYTHGEGGEGSASGPLTAWGETASTRFDGREGTLSLDGEVTTSMLGLDKRQGRWLVGAVLSHSRGGGGYRRSRAPGGAMDSTLTSLSPYAHYELNEATSLWGVVGYGVGKLRLTPEGAPSAIETELSNHMAAFGGRGLLSVRSGEAGRFELALRSDALLTRTDSEAVTGLSAARGATSRVRVLLEGSGSMPLGARGTLKPSLEAGLRYDAGDAETGAGIEIGGGLGYSAGRLGVEVNGRALVAHEDTDYEEWGFSTSIVYAPAGDGRGLSMKFGSAWGATQSGVRSLWNQQDASGLARNAAFEAAQRFEGELGYGLEGRKDGSLWLPYVGVESSDTAGQALWLGVKLTSGERLDAGFEMGREALGRGGYRHALQLTGSLRW